MGLLVVVVVGEAEVEAKSGGRDLNPQQRDWKSRTLPLSYRREEDGGIIAGRWGECQ